MKMYRIAIIGAGANGMAHINFLQQNARCRVIAVSDSHEQALADAALKTGIQKQYRDYRQMIKTESPDAVLISAPHSIHAPAALTALEAGSHVFTEKPPTISAEETRAVLRAAKRSGRIFMCGFSRRFNPSSMMAKRMIMSGALGNIYHIRAYWHAGGIGAARSEKLAQSWRGQKRLAGGGVLMDLGVHLIDLSLWCCGNPAPVSVYGNTCRTFLPPDNDTEDFAEASIILENRCSVSIETSNMGFSDDTNCHHYFYGTCGCLHLTADPDIEIAGANADSPSITRIKVVSPPGYKSYLEAEHEQFFNALDTGQPPDASQLEYLDVSRIADAVYESHETKATINLPVEKADWQAEI